MRKTSLKCAALKYRRVIIYYFSLYDGRVHRKIFKDYTLFEALAAFYILADFHCWTCVDYYCIKY
jgi:hypothetical protein